MGIWELGAYGLNYDKTNPGMQKDGRGGEVWEMIVCNEQERHEERGAKKKDRLKERGRKGCKAQSARSGEMGKGRRGREDRERGEMGKLNVSH